MQTTTATTTTTKRIPSACRTFLPMPRLVSQDRSSVKYQARRPTISAPVGPVKNSRGPDLTRSKKFIIVDGIKDCSSLSSGSQQNGTGPCPAQAMQTTRRISAGFQTDQRLARSPTVAPSAVTVTAKPKSRIPTPIKAGSPLQKAGSSLQKTGSPVQKVMPRAISSTIPSAIPSGKSRLPVSSTISHLPRLASKTYSGISTSTPVRAQERKTSKTMISKTTETSAPKSKLPKSRTMDVLSDIKSSISRSSLMPRAANARVFDAPSSRKTSNSSTTTTLPDDSSQSEVLGGSQTSLSAATETSSSNSSVQSAPSISSIETAQPSQYWTGRFVGLYDRLTTEALMTRTGMSSFMQSCNDSSDELSAPGGHKKSSAPRCPAGISQSSTTSALNKMPHTAVGNQCMSEEEMRCLRVFQYLDSQCITAEARQSLREWQDAYARRFIRLSLLPEDDYEEEKSPGFIVRIFGSGNRKTERQGLAALREATIMKVKKLALAADAVGRRNKKRLSGC